MPKRFLILVIAALSSVARGQSINLDVGPPAAQPPASYAAAGLSGYWNSTTAEQNSYTYDLRTLDGTITPVYVWQYGGTELRNDDDPATTGNDQLLMDHCLITYTPNLETCLFFFNLEPGDYEVLLYAWMPNHPSILSYASCDEEPGRPHSSIGGAWPGGQVQGVTYSRHYATVSDPQFRLRVHSGIVPGADPALGAACNGAQVRKLPNKSAGDMNCDGKVNGADIAPFIQVLLNRPAYYAAQPACRYDNADLSGDGVVSAADIPLFVSQLLTAA